MVTYEASLKVCHINRFIHKTVHRNDREVYVENAGGQKLPTRLAQKLTWTVITYYQILYSMPVGR